MDNLDDILISADASISEAMAAIDRGAVGIALLVDGGRRLRATITDGDIRRAILDGAGPEAPVTTLLERRPLEYQNPTVAWASTDRQQLLRMMQSKTIRQVPLVDDEMRVVDVALLADLIDHRVHPISAVLMAGGHGSRLRPLTDDVPKPMLEVGGRPVMERLIEQLHAAGIRQVNVTTHYKPEVISKHFGDGNGNGVEISYMHESEPLGTAGALGLMDVPQEPVLVVNGDILTELNLRAMFDFHREHNADMTVAVKRYQLQVPYGVVETRGVEVSGLAEKPSLDFFINAGIYLLEPVAYEYIPVGERFDMPDLIRRMVDKGRRTVSFPILEYWVDIGRPADYDQAQQDVADRRLESWTGAKSLCL